ncbi:MAG: hypothetical protein QM778_01550 [Myxococcales bacterium]
MFGAGREMRSVEAASGAFLRGARCGLVIGKRLPALENSREISALSELGAVAGGFDAVLWRLDRNARTALGELRVHLLPGARLFLLAELVPSVWGVTRELLGGKEIVRFSREVICEDVLVSGLLNPRISDRHATTVGHLGELARPTRVARRGFRATSGRLGR